MIEEGKPGHEVGLHDDQGKANDEH
jgi:hypothetical protein